VLSCRGGRATFAEAVGGLRALCGPVPVVLVCGSLRDSDVRAALAAGARGVVLEEDAAAALGPCVRAILAGQVCVPSRYGRHADPPVLSAREKQILGLVVMGLMNSEIAARLFLAESTVKSHLSSAFAKLGVRSRHEAADLILDPAGGLSLGILALHAPSAERELATRA
jgi:DNA-binding NarL/FixJ family response regulator